MPATSPTSATSPTRPSALDLEERLLDGERRYTRDQLARLVGVDLPRLRRFWRALGFADVGDEAVVFTDGDLAAARAMMRLVETGVVDEESALRITRALGQTSARLVEWQLEALVGPLVAQAQLAPDEVARAAVEKTERLLPELERLHAYVLRRQLAALAGRVLTASAEDPAVSRACVGFADLVGFTGLTRRLEAAELADLVETFESRAADVVAALGGRLVKTLGDEVMFVVDDASVAVEIALELVRMPRAARAVPPLRVGIARGNVLSRMGDLYGTTVNLASRLTAMAPPGQVYVDTAIARAASRERPFRFEPQPPRRARGLGQVEPVRVITRG